MARSVLTRPWLLEWASSRTIGMATVLMMHRFSEREDGRGGIPVDQLDRHLTWLRRHNFNLVSLSWLERALRIRARIPPKTVAMTVDDGYEDFARLAYPVFARHACPVTVFLITGFIDDRSWLWWDRIEYVLHQTPASCCELLIHGRAHEFSWGTPEERSAVARQIAAILKWMPAEERATHLAGLEDQLGVRVPPVVTGDFAPLSWDIIRGLEDDLVSFGPHSVSHPILAKESDGSVASEIAGSWARLRAETRAPLPTFCLPNGDPHSFGLRELKAIRASGLTAAVSTIGDYVFVDRDRPAEPDDVVLLPRMQIESSHDRFVQVVSGVDRLKRMVLGSRRQPA